MRPLRNYSTEKIPGFKELLIPIGDNIFLQKDVSYTIVIFEHDNSLECHGFSNSAFREYTFREILKQPILRVPSMELVECMRDMIDNMTIRDSKDCTGCRTACKRWEGNHYIHRVYCGHFNSVYAFAYSVSNESPIIQFQVVNYGPRNSKGSFSIESSIIEQLSNVLHI